MSRVEKILAKEKKSKLILFSVVFLFIALLVISNLVAPPELDNNFCPKDSEKVDSHHISMLIDLSDELTNLNKKIVKSILFDWLESGTSQQKLSIYSLKSTDMNSFEDIDTVCSPPSKLSLSSRLGREKAEQKINQFKIRMEGIIEAGSKVSMKLNESKLLESIRQVSNSPNWYVGHSRLVIVSDLIEKSRYANFYSKEVPDFHEWIASPENQSLISDINISRGDKVQICQLRTDKPGFDARNKAKLFWISLLQLKGVKEVALNCNGIVKDN